MNSLSECCEPMLKESLKHFLASHRNGNSDFSSFESIFFRLLQSMPDPPLEIAWFYSAVIFYRARSAPNGPSTKMVLLAKESFQLLIYCSNWSNGLKKIAFLAPVMYQLYNITCDSNMYGSCLRKEIEDLVENVVSYTSLCCYDDCEEGTESDHLVVSFEDLVRVWTIDRVGDNTKFEECLRVFFPVLSDDVRKGINERCRIQNLAQIVLFEVFLLRLSLQFDLLVLRDKLQTNMHNLAVQMIEGFQNCCFIDTLLRMLLEPALPITSLLSSEDAVFLRKILYDAVILFDYSFLYSGRWTQLQDNHLRNLALLWSLVVDTAVQFARDISDHSRAVSYVNTFLKSQLSTQLIKWVSNQAGMEERFRPNTCTPRALVRWLLLLEDQGIGVFDHNISTLLPKASVSRIVSDTDIPDFSNDDHNPKENFLTYCRGSNRMECEVMYQEIDDPLLAEGLPGINTSGTEGKRKHKEGIIDLGEARAKLVRYDPHESSIYHGKFGNGSETENPVTDEDIEVMITG